MFKRLYIRLFQYIFKLLYRPPMPRPVLPQVQLWGLQCQPSVQRCFFQILGLDACHQDGERVIVEEERGQVGFRILAAKLVGGMLEGDPMRAGAIQMDSCVVIKLLVQDGCYLMLQERLEAEAGG